MTSVTLWTYGIPDFHQGFTVLQEIEGRGKDKFKDLAQPRVGGIAASEPRDLWRWPQRVDQACKAGIFRHNNRSCLAGVLVNSEVISGKQVQVDDGHALGGKTSCHPWSEARGEVGIKPEYHATTTGWLTCLLAKWRQARISSISRIGSSSTTCSGVRPLTRRSSTSITRTRNPRMHGFPPHSSGFTVIRSAICAMMSSRPIISSFGM